MDWSEFHEKRYGGPITLPLAVLSTLYGIGIRLRERSIKRRRGRALPGFVLSIGNITAGGTGKTPAAMMIAKWAMARGRRVAVLSRGYGGRYGRRVLEVSDGQRLLVDPAMAGDEPCLMAMRLQGIPIVVARERYRAGFFASGKFNSDFFVLDDGFQHRALARDLDLVLLDAESPFGNGHLLPRGPLREPVFHLARAGAFLMTRWSGTQAQKDAADSVGTRFPGIPIFRAAHIADQVIFPATHEARDPEFLRGKRVVAFAAIARPRAFRNMLLEQGVDLLNFRTFRDHHHFTEKEIRDLVSMKSALGAEFIITTEKDLVRITRPDIFQRDLAFLRITMRPIPEDAFFDFLTRTVFENRAGNS